MPSLLDAARAMQATYHKGGLQGWLKIGDVRRGPGGLDASAFQKGNEVMVCIEGQRFWTPRDIFAMARRFLARRGLPAKPYADSGEEFVRNIRRLDPNANITMVGHSGGCGWAAFIGRRLGLPTIAFNGGFDALRTLPELDQPTVTSVEIEGDKWGDSSRGSPRFRRIKVMRLRKPDGERSHFMRAIIKALETQEA